MTTPQDEQLGIETMYAGVDTLLTRITRAVAEDRLAPESVRDALDELDEILDYWICAAQETNEAFRSHKDDLIIPAMLSNVAFADTFHSYLHRRVPASDEERHFAKVRRLLETYGSDLMESLRSLCEGRRALLKSLSADADGLFRDAGLAMFESGDPRERAAELGADAQMRYEDKLRRFEDTLTDLVAAQANLRAFIAQHFPLAPSATQYVVNAHNVGVVGSGSTVEQQDFPTIPDNALPPSG